MVKEKKKAGIALALWCLSIIGLAGIHRFYAGKIGTGILWLVTFGLFGIGQLIDLFFIVTGNFKDKEGNKLEW